ncbi:MAG TPA: hypothetical protein VHG32_20005 [Thermoanaerobaculia bacterium]|jgi:uncharacterized protein YhaN|nr:hypothetical protein [Thermoanaerobaculia bacterium]
MSGLGRLLQAGWAAAARLAGSQLTGLPVAAAAVLALVLLLSLSLAVRAGWRLAALRTESARRFAENSSRLEQLASRLARLEKVNEAQEMDARVDHDGDVAALLGPLLELNDALHRGRGSKEEAP